MGRRRYGFLLLICCLLLVLLGAVVVAEGRRTPDWQVAFRQALPAVTIKAATRGTDLRAFAQLTEELQLIERGDMLSLPTQPRTLYCVVGQRGKQEQLYLTAFYDDSLWHADWTIWASGAGSAREQQTAAKDVGCSFGAEHNLR